MQWISKWSLSPLGRISALERHRRSAVNRMFRRITADVGWKGRCRSRAATATVLTAQCEGRLSSRDNPDGCLLVYPRPCGRRGASDRGPALFGAVFCSGCCWEARPIPKFGQCRPSAGALGCAWPPRWSATHAAGMATPLRAVDSPAWHSRGAPTRAGSAGICRLVFVLSVDEILFAIERARAPR